MKEDKPQTLAGKVALITGAGQGIGQGIAFSLAKRGAKIAALGRTVSKCETTCESIKEMYGIDCIAIECDVSDSSLLQPAVERALAELGDITILVNNAVGTTLGPLLSQTEENMMHAFKVGPVATLKLMQLCHAGMKNAGGGSIINLASTAAKRWDMKNFGIYAAEKDAIKALTRAAASEWGEDNIRANCILPHATSPALKWWIENYPEEAEELRSTIPLQRIGDCEADIGEFVAMLCSEESRYVSGQSIAIDGGQAFMS